MEGLIKKFIQFAMGNGIVLILGFISSPIITRVITPEEMGKFSMFTTVTNLLLLLVLLGTDQSYVRYYYEEDENNRGRLLRRCIIPSFIVNMLIAIILLIFYKEISLYIVEENSLVIIILVIIHLFGSILTRFTLLEIRMKQRAKLFSLFNVLTKLLYLIFVLILFYIYQNNYMTLVLATILSNVIVGIFSLFIERKEWFNFNKNHKCNIKISDIIKYGIPFIFSMAITWVFQSIDRISIKEFCGYKEIGLYSGAMSIISLLNALQGAFTTFWVPVAYERFCKEPDNTHFFTKVNEIVSIVMLIVGIILITSKDLIVFLLGEKYREAVFIFPYLVFMPIMFTISETTVLGINFKKKTNAHIYIAIISAIVNVIGNLLLVPSYGATGAAISTGLSYIVFFAIRTYISKKYFKVKYNLLKFTISTISVYILAIYSSFRRFDNIILLLSITSIVVIALAYKKTIVYIIKFAKKKINLYEKC